MKFVSEKVNVFISSDLRLITEAVWSRLRIMCTLGWYLCMEFRISWNIKERRTQKNEGPKSGKQLLAGSMVQLSAEEVGILAYRLFHQASTCWMIWNKCLSELLCLAAKSYKGKLDKTEISKCVNFAVFLLYCMTIDAFSCSPHGASKTLSKQCFGLR